MIVYDVRILMPDDKQAENMRTLLGEGWEPFCVNSFSLPDGLGGIGIVSVISLRRAREVNRIRYDDFPPMDRPMGGLPGEVD